MNDPNLEYQATQRPSAIHLGMSGYLNPDPIWIGAQESNRYRKR
jgi:hypothetical protein